LRPPIANGELNQLQPTLTAQSGAGVGNVRHEDLRGSIRCGYPYRYRRSSPHFITPRYTQPPWEEHPGAQISDIAARPLHDDSALREAVEYLTSSRHPHAPTVGKQHLDLRADQRHRESRRS